MHPATASIIQPSTTRSSHRTHLPISQLRFANPIVLLAACLCSLAFPARANQPKPETAAALDRYRTLTEARMDADRKAGHFLYFDRFPEAQRAEIDAQLRRGEFYLEQLHTLDGNDRIHVPDGLIHHWIGAGFLPGATLAQTKSVLEDFDHQKITYYPEVRQSKLVSEQNGVRNVFLQFWSHTVITTVFNVNFDSRTVDYSPTQTQIRACSTRVAEVEGFSTPQERELSPADAHGYLWSLCTWWHIEEKGRGTYIQVEAIELSRTVPWVFAWIVNPIIRNVPKEFLSRLLASTRKAVTKKSSGAVPKSSATRRDDVLAAYYRQPCSASFSSICRASGLLFLEAATSKTWACAQLFCTPSPRMYRSASVTSAGTYPFLTPDHSRLTAFGKSRCRWLPRSISFAVTNSCWPVPVSPGAGGSIARTAGTVELFVGIDSLASGFAAADGSDFARAAVSGFVVASAESEAGFALESETGAGDAALGLSLPLVGEFDLSAPPALRAGPSGVATGAGFDCACESAGGCALAATLRVAFSPAIFSPSPTRNRPMSRRKFTASAPRIKASARPISAPATARLVRDGERSMLARA
jgi:hypothetical protein